MVDCINDVDNWKIKEKDLSLIYSERLRRLLFLQHSKTNHHKSDEINLLRYNYKD